MKIAYNDALKQIRQDQADLKSPFSERLFDHKWSYLDQSEPQIARVEKTADSSQVEVKEQTQSVTEKVKILDELHKFGKEAFEKSKSDRIHLGSGAVIDKKVAKNPLWETELLSLDEVYEFYQKHSVQLSEVKKQEQSQLDILFITDENFQATLDSSVEEKKIAAFYEPNVATLFQNMVRAMKVDSSRYTVSTLSEDIEGIEKILISEVLHKRPKYIVTLGGYISSKVLQTKERLQSLRGKFYKIDMKNSEDSDALSFELLPLFSPSYLHEAPNSKRLAWEDMQLLMQKLS